MIQVQNYIISDAHVAKLQEYILNHLAKTPFGAQSVSYLVDCIRMDLNVNFPTNHSFAMDVFTALGFTIKQGQQIDPRRKAKHYSWAVTL